MNIAGLNNNHQTRRLALGLELEDLLRETELICSVRVEAEYTSPHKTSLPSNRYSFAQTTLAPKGLLRSSTGRYSLSYYPSIKEQIDIRIYDYERCYVPRRLRVPLRTLADVIDRENNEVLNYMEGHHRNIILFPGSSYHLLSNVTGLRGRVLRNGEPMRWACVSAMLSQSTHVIAQTRGDDRGEFLLVLPPQAAPASELNSTLAIDVVVSGPTVAPIATSALIESDELWDLPLEEVPAIGATDNVSNGKTLPAGYTSMPARAVNFSVGRVLTGRDEADFNFVVP